MQILRYNKRSSRLRLPSDLKTYFDLELLITSEEFYSSGAPIPFADCIYRSEPMLEGYPRELFTEGGLFPFVTLGSNQRLVEHVAEPGSTPRNPKFRRELCGTTGDAYRNVFIYTFYDPILPELELFEQKNIFDVRRVNAHLVYTCRTRSAVEKLLRTWQIYHYVNLENGGDVHMAEEIPELGELVPELSLEAYSLKCFRKLYAHYNPEMPHNGLSVEEAARLYEYRQVVNHFYEDNIIRQFSMLPDPFSGSISEFLHNECEDCRMIVHVSGLGISIRRGLDRKLLPYFDQKFKLQPEEDEANEQKA